MGCSPWGLQRVGHHRVKMNKCKKSKLDGTRPRIQLLSGVQLFETPWTAAHKAFLSITNSQSFLKPVSLPWWFHPTTSSSVHTLYLQSVPASGYFPVSQFFASGGQSIGASALASVLPMNIQSWLTGLISLLFKGLSRVFSNTTVQILTLWGSAFFKVEISHPHMTTRKPQPSLYGPWLVKWCLCFLIYCLGLSKLFFQGASILISWLQSQSGVILEPSKIKPHCFHCFSIYLSRSDGNGCHSVKFSLVT